MPTLPPKPCRHHGCAQLVRDGSGYCGNHQGDRRINRFGDDRRGSASSRGYGSDWRVLRDQVMQRDGGLCQPCRQLGRVSVAKQVDHVVPKAEGGTDDLANLQAICPACHAAKTGREAARGRGASNL